MSSELEVLLFFTVFLVFWLFVHLLNKSFSLEKYGVKVSVPFLKYESQRFKAFLEKTSLRRQLLWKVFSNLSISIGGGLLFFVIYFLTQNLLRFVQPSGVSPSPVVPVLPGLTIRLYWLPYFILGFLVAALTHETAHGVIARIEGVNIKSAGLFLALIQPGGFVELNEEELERSLTTSKMRILSAGSSMNLLTGLLFFLVVSLLFLRTPAGIVVIEVLEDGPLELAGLQRWDVIYAVNGTRIETRGDLGRFMEKVTPSDRLILSTSRGSISVTTTSDRDEPDEARIGIASYIPYYPSKLRLGFFWDVQLYMTMSWVFLVLVNLAIFNMLPIPLLDGDRFLKYFLQGFSKNYDRMRMFFNALSLFLIAANMALSVSTGLFAF